MSHIELCHYIGGVLGKCPQHFCHESTPYCLKYSESGFTFLCTYNSGSSSFLLLFRIKLIHIAVPVIQVEKIKTPEKCYYQVQERMQPELPFCNGRWNPRVCCRPQVYFKPRTSVYPQYVPYSCELLLFVQDWANLQWLCSYKECIFQCFDLMTIIQAEVSSFLTLFQALCGKPLCHCSPQKNIFWYFLSVLKPIQIISSSVAYEINVGYLFK